MPSHGIRAYGQIYAIDILHPSPPGAPTSVPWSGGMDRPEGFSCFGEPVYAVAPGRVVAVTGGRRDHRSRTSWRALVYLMTIEAFVRELGGPGSILGNHVVLDHGDDVYSAYAHLHRGSPRVGVGETVEAGTVLGEVGNSGNTTEPHLHIQLMDRARVTAAAGLPFRWPGVQIRPGDLDPTRTGKDAPEEPGHEGLPANGQIFTAIPRSTEDGPPRTRHTG